MVYNKFYDPEGLANLELYLTYKCAFCFESDEDKKLLLLIMKYFIKKTSLALTDPKFYASLEIFFADTNILPEYNNFNFKLQNDDKTMFCGINKSPESSKKINDIIKNDLSVTTSFYSQISAMQYLGIALEIEKKNNYWTD